MSKCKIQPLNDKVLVKAIQSKEQQKGGIVIPDSAREKPQEAVVVAIGPGKRRDDGKRVPMKVKIGDRVVTSKYGGTEIKHDDHEYKLLDLDEILAIIE